mgnify:CR=1 FL=1
MAFLLDSDQIISYLNGRKEVIEKIDDLAEEELFTSIVCVAEVLEGIYDTENEDQRLSQLNEFLQDIQALIVDRKVADQFAKIRSDLRKKGNLIENMDILIASTALVNKLTLVTNNKKDFERIEELKLYSESHH